MTAFTLRKKKRNGTLIPTDAIPSEYSDAIKIQHFTKKLTSGHLTIMPYSMQSADLHFPSQLLHWSACSGFKTSDHLQLQAFQCLECQLITSTTRHGNHASLLITIYRVGSLICYPHCAFSKYQTSDFRKIWHKCGRNQSSRSYPPYSKSCKCNSLAVVFTKFGNLADTGLPE